MKKLTIVKFGGSLINLKKHNLDPIVHKVKELKDLDDVGPIAIFSAPKGYTNMLMEIGRSKVRSGNADLSSVFEPYNSIANNCIKTRYLKAFLKELDLYRLEAEETLLRLNKRFDGSNKARLLTTAGELLTSTFMTYVLRSSGVKSCHLSKEMWPIITDDNYDNALMNYDQSKRRVNHLTSLLNEGNVICQAGFLGMTEDGLETLLGRGGSDQTAVIDACLLKGMYTVKVLLLKETPVSSADPAVVPDQKLENIRSMTYNEAIKASAMGMKIVQSSAVRLARTFNLPINVAPMGNSQTLTLIQNVDSTSEIVKCVTGANGCAILTINNEKSKSLEDCLRLWENYEDFIDLGTEVLETGKVVRDFLVLDAGFVKQNEDRLKSFDSEIEIEYNVGVVTLIGDRMKYSPGIASIAIGTIPEINIKRAVFAPHTSQIILVVKEHDVKASVRAIHSKRAEINTVIASKID